MLCRVAGSDPDMLHIKSSANAWRLFGDRVLRARRRSSSTMLKRKGDKMPPCGDPFNILCRVVCRGSDLTRC